MPLVTVEVLGVSPSETEPTVLLTVDGCRYVFNVSEGVQRFCMEHKVRLKKSRGIFLSSMSSAHTGGVPGMLMTLSDIGITELSLGGPPGTGALIDATRNFFRRSDLNLCVQEFCPSSQLPYDDGAVKIYGRVFRQHEECFDTAAATGGGLKMQTGFVEVDSPNGECNLSEKSWKRRRRKRTGILFLQFVNRTHDGFLSPRCFVYFLLRLSF